MRHVYQLQSETIKVLKGREQSIADELNVTDRYIYAILAGSETDPFAKFIEIYAAAVRDGAPVRHWEERMEAIRAKHESRERLSLRTEAKCFAKESTNVSIAAIDDLDPHAVLREAREAIAQGKRVEKAALAAIEAAETAKKSQSAFDPREAVRSFRSKKVSVGNGR